MAFNFLFNQELSQTLEQGDILKRTPQLRDAIKQAHSYYAEAESYTHFMVLTQSCDLVVRKKDRPKAPYITIAAIRPFRILIDRLLSKYEFQYDAASVSLCDATKHALAQELIERFIHNVEPNYFFIPEGSHPQISQDMCAFLALSIALRSDHYQVCREAKIAQLAPEFQSKVGWLAGNMYSRVATPDVEEHEPDSDAIKQAIFDRTIYQYRKWLTPIQLSEFKLLAKSWKRSNPDLTLDSEMAGTLAREIPENEVILARRVALRLREAKLISTDGEATEERIVQLLRNDRVLKSLVRPGG